MEIVKQLAVVGMLALLGTLMWQSAQPVKAQGRPVTFANGWLKAERVDVEGYCVIVVYNQQRPGDSVTAVPCVR